MTSPTHCAKSEKAPDRTRPGACFATALGAPSEGLPHSLRPLLDDEPELPDSLPDAPDEPEVPVAPALPDVPEVPD